ncbi:MAG: HDOD domain-containing protein [Methylobacter sp.]
MNPISNCLDVINRLGLMTTRNLVTAFSMKDLIQSKNLSTKNLFRITDYKASRYPVLTILTQIAQKADPDEALLEGLFA